MNFTTESKLSEAPAEAYAEDMTEEFMVLQGECKIQTIHPLERPPWYILIPKVLMFFICTLLVIGLLIIRYSKKVRRWLLYRDTQFDKCSHVFITGNDESDEIEDVFTDINGKKVFMYRKLKYGRTSGVYHPIGYATAKAGHLFNPEFYKTGLTNPQVEINRQIYGLCEHKVEIPGYFQYMGSQLIKPFFILQYVVCVSYIIERNIQFAIIMIVLSLITTTINYILLRLSYQKIKEIAQHSAEIDVLRNGKIIKVDSTQLVPGDLFSPQEMIPCDCILTKGEVYVNEASLTGENIPIGKFPPAAMSYLSEDNCWLFEGAKVLELRGDPIALVVNTGFSTRKGRIFRKILNNVSTLPEFFANGVKFLLIMAAACYIIYFGFIALMLQRKFTSIMIIFRALDIVGWAVPAAMPIYFNLCYSLGLARLRRSKIYGTEPQKTIVAGKVKTMCFDKTGTLTLNNMQLFSIHRIISSDNAQEIIASEVTTKNSNDIMYKHFASCHTVRRINEEFMGDELDLRMFLFSDFRYEVPSDTSIKLTLWRDSTQVNVLRINQFESKFQCMSVLVQDVNEKKYYVFVKGAAQKIQRTSLNKYIKYDELISNLSLAGLRNIAFAYKEISPEEVSNYMTCKREEFEKGLTLLGVVAFENKLKNDTVDTIRKLMDANIEPKIITGDNIFIAVETGLRTGILPHGSRILLLEGRKQRNQPGIYNGIILKHDKVQSHSQPVTLTHQQYLEQQLPIGVDNDFLKLNPAPQLPDNVKLFARISPEWKASIVRQLKKKWQAINNNFKVGMCGDGANDLMAIKDADVGMGISDTDSSFAANFSIPQLICVEQIIRDGKATLTNIIEIYLYYGATSFLKATSSFILMYDNSYMNANQITFYNYTSVLILNLLFAFSGPADALTSKIPNDNFMSWQNALIYIGNWLIPTVGLILCQYLTVSQDYFAPMPPTTLNWYFKNYTNTSHFLSLQLIMVGILIGIYIARPFKKMIFYNIPMTVLLIIDLAFYTALFFVLKGFLQTLPIDNALSGKLFAISVATIVLSIFFSRFIRWVFSKEEVEVQHNKHQPVVELSALH